MAKASTREGDKNIRIYLNIIFQNENSNTLYNSAVSNTPEKFIILCSIVEYLPDRGFREFCGGGRGSMRR